MLPRSWTALLLLINYLLVVGTGCVSRPEELRERLLVQTSTTDQSYQECRYLRMDGLENFLTETLASRYENKSENPKHYLISVVGSVDAHCLPQMIHALQHRLFVVVTPPRIAYRSTLAQQDGQPLIPPPWRQ